jgi:hypothetical protein
MNPPDPLHAPRTGDQNRIFHISPMVGTCSSRTIGKPKILPAKPKAFKRTASAAIVFFDKTGYRRLPTTCSCPASESAAG